MPDPTENQITQERSDLEFRQIRPGESDQQWDARMAQGNPLINVPIATNQGVSSSDAPVGGSVIPPVNTVGENIDQTVNPGGMSAQDLATIQQAKSLYTPAQQIPVTPTPSNAALMPMLNQPINVGTSSGQITGSHGVYVDPGFVAPWGAIMQKQAAQDEQTNLALKNQQLAKQARDKAFKFEKPKFEVKDPGFQKSLNEAATSTINSFTDQAKELGGKDWQVMLKTDTRLGREFQSAMDGLNLLVRNADRATDKFAEIDEGIKSGDVYYSDEIRKIRRDYENLTDEAFGGGDIEKLAGIRQLYKDLDGHMELNTFLNDKGILSNIKGQISGSTGISDMGEFKQLKTTNRTLYDENIKNIIQSVKKSMGSEYPYTDEDIETTLLGHFQNESTSKKSLKAKPKGGGGSGRRINKEDINLEIGSKPIKVTYRSGTDEDGNPITSEGSFEATRSQPVPSSTKSLNGVGLQFVGADGEATLQSDVSNLIPVEAEVIKYKDDDGNIKERRVIVVTETREDPVMIMGFDTGKTKETELTHLVDYDSNKDRWRTDLGTEFDDQFSNVTLEGDEQETQEGTAVFKNGQWVLK